MWTPATRAQHSRAGLRCGSDLTDAEWAVLDLLVPGVRGQQKPAAAALGITAQAVSQAVQRSYWNEEHACRPAAARLRPRP